MVIGSDKPSLKVSTAEVGEGQVIYLEDTTLESKDSEFSTIPFTRRQGRSFRSGTSLNLTEPDDDDDRVMVKGTGLKSSSQFCWRQDTGRKTLYFEFVSEVLTSVAVGLVNYAYSTC